ncbi:MAG: hypothetical protein IJ196_06675 [Prevotella sp.]|nr:hypothetical protein [Prevotella sp.]
MAATTAKANNATIIFLPFFVLNCYPNTCRHHRQPCKDLERQYLPALSMHEAGSAPEALGLLSLRLGTLRARSALCYPHAKVLCFCCVRKQFQGKHHSCLFLLTNVNGREQQELLKSVDIFGSQHCFH